MIVSDNELESVYVLPAISGTYWGQTMTAGTAYYVAGHNTGCPAYTPSGAATSAYLCQPAGVAVDPSGDITVASPEINRVFTIGNVLAITPTSLPGGFVNQDYGPTTLNAAGAAPPFTWALTTGALPPGLNFGSDGTITGTPTTSGTFDFTVQASSSDIPPQSVTEPLSITVQGLTINAATPAEGFVNVAYSSPALTASNGYTPFSWSVISGTPPPGVNLNADGTWTGTPTTQGTYSFTVQVIDSDPAGAQMAAAPLSIVVEPYATSIINTVAGTGLGGNGTSTSGSSPATTAIGEPAGVTTDAFGNTIIADELNGEVDVIAAETGTFYGVSMTTGEIYLVAGGGVGSSTGTGNLATGFGLTNPDGLAIDGAGNLVVSDFGNDQVYVVANNTAEDFGQMMSAGDIYLLAGGGFGFSGAGGPATSAAMGEPTGVAVDHSGNVLISDTIDNTIWEVADSTTPMYGIASPTVGDIYTIADSGGSQGDTGDGAAATTATLQYPTDVAVDSAGNVVIADTFNNAVRVIAESTTPIYGIASPVVGDIYTIAGNGTSAFAGDGGPAASSELSDPFAVTFDSLGNLYVADTGNNRIRMIPSSDGTYYGLSMVANATYTVAGDGTQGFSGDGHASGLAELDSTTGVAVTPDGTLVVADTSNDRVRDVVGGLPTAGTPSTPSGLMATPGNGQVVLNWNTASDATGYSVYDATTTGGEVTTGTPACTAVAPATTCTVSPLINGTEYFFVVVATNGTNASAPSGEANATPEAAPGNFTLSPTAENGQVQLGWTASANAGSYTVFYAPSPGDPPSGSTACTATTSLMCTVGGLANGTTYNFEVVATGVGGSTDSNEAPATPEAAPGPFTLGATAGDGQVALSWSSSTNASSYTVWYAASPGDPLIHSSTCVATTALLCTVSGLANGTSYSFEVVASGPGGSTDSNEVSATPEIQPGAFSLTSATPSSGQVVVDWGASTNAANGYTLYYSTSSGTELAGSTACANTTLTTCTVSGLTNGTKYYFEVEAFDGTVTTLSSNELNATPEIQPGAFSLTSATPSTGQVVVDWGTSTNAANGYTLYYSTSPGTELAGSTACANTTLTTCTVSGLTNGTKYYFEVEAFDGTVTTLSSNELNATPEIQPGAFSLTSATPSSGQVVVDWGTSSNAANGYTLYYSTSPGTELAGSTACAATTLTTCTVSGLTNGTKYYFEVEAFDGTVTTLSSNELNATPEIQPGAFSLTSATPSTGQVVVDWGTSSNAANGYTLYYSTSLGHRAGRLHRVRRHDADDLHGERARQRHQVLLRGRGLRRHRDHAELQRAQRHTRDPARRLLADERHALVGPGRRGLGHLVQCRQRLHPLLLDLLGHRAGRLHRVRRHDADDLHGERAHQRHQVLLRGRGLRRHRDHAELQRAQRHTRDPARRLLADERHALDGPGRRGLGHLVQRRQRLHPLLLDLAGHRAGRLHRVRQHDADDLHGERARQRHQVLLRGRGLRRHRDHAELQRAQRHTRDPARRLLADERHALDGPGRRGLGHLVQCRQRLHPLLLDLLGHRAGRLHRVRRHDADDLHGELAHQRHQVLLRGRGLRRHRDHAELQRAQRHARDPARRLLADERHALDGPGRRGLGGLDQRRQRLHPLLLDLLGHRAGRLHRVRRHDADDLHGERARQRHQVLLRGRGLRRHRDHAELQRAQRHTRDPARRLLADERHALDGPGRRGLGGLDQRRQRLHPLLLDLAGHRAGRLHRVRRHDADDLHGERAHQRHQVLLRGRGLRRHRDHAELQRAQRHARDPARRLLADERHALDGPGRRGLGHLVQRRQRLHPLLLDLARAPSWPAPPCAPPRR